MPVDTAVAVVLVRSDRAASLRRSAVHIRGFQGIHAGPNEFIFGAPGLGVNQAEEFDWKPLGAGEPVFARAGVAPTEIGTLHCYDGFSPQVLWTLERFGFCAPGEAADWIAAHGALRIDADRAGQIIWALASPDVARMFCDGQGWTQEQYAEWLDGRESRATAEAPAFSKISTNSR